MLALVVFQITELQQTWVGGMLLHFVHHGLRHLAFVKRVYALLCNALQHLGIVRIAQPVPYRVWLTLRLIKISASSGV